MKKLAYIIVLVAALAAGQALAVQVTQIALNYENGATVARVTADGPFQVSHQTEVPKEGKGDRMILDIIGVTTGLSAKSYTNLPVCGITGIRTGQYAVTPEKVVRVVFDLTKPPVYQVERQGNCVKITFSDKAATAFSTWSTDAAKPAQPVVAPKPAVAAAPTVAPATVSNQTAPVDKAKLAETDRLTSLSGLPTPAVQPTATPVTPAPNTSTVKVVTVDAKTVAPAVQQPAPTSVKVVATENPKPAVPTVIATPAPVAPKPTTTTPAPTPTPVVAVKPAQPEVKTTVPVTTASKPAPSAPETTVKPNVQATPPAVAVKPATPSVQANQIQQALSVKPSPTETAQKPVEVVKALDTKPADKPLASVPAAPTQQNPQPAPTVASAPDTKPAVETATPVTPVPTVATVTPSDKKDQPATTVTIPRPLTDDESAQVAEADDAASANPDLPANKSTSRFRRSAAADAKIKGTMVAEFPQRLVVKYESLGNRDPFATLIDDSRTFNTPIENRVPNIDGLRLVGIIESDRGASDNRALFEDKNGYSYILSSGDKVQRGYVLRVEDDRVYFQIFEYGWSRTVALAIENAN
ncbi:hypothetical protein C3F09_12115 [candidate division GN15 bacterium]|uniref:AMIN domain-containing protein n=1 Tax=candidate division GN15 bacterium TaxID=2072418 RepID=A0A855X2H4_9BACT|nr:MAG: hypothetical protein C3F09_12115 [candidate division GN15 bacterium]